MVNLACRLFFKTVGEAGALPGCFEPFRPD